MMKKRRITNIDVSYLINKSIDIRESIVETCIEKGGHPASSLSCVEILVALYYSNILNIYPDYPNNPHRDIFILSKGHAATILYIVLSDKGFFPKEWINKYYRAGDCRLGGHPDKKIPGVEISTGALGHGLGVAVGMSIAAKMDNKENYHFVLMGDAECTEGSVWEAAMSASYHQLSNLVGLIDLNEIGGSDFTENYSDINNMEEKWAAFGWNVFSCDGHNINDLVSILEKIINNQSNKPSVIVAKTIKGKGVSFLENHPLGHVMQINSESEKESARRDIKELRQNV